MASKCAPSTPAALAGGGGTVVVKKESLSPALFASASASGGRPVVVKKELVPFAFGCGCSAARSSHDATPTAAARRAIVGSGGGIALPLTSPPSGREWSLPRGRAFDAELAFIRLRAHSSTAPVHRRDMVDLEESEPQ
ncbi:hypothetical protein V5799_014325, partial [Amblyomma americanum]